MRDPTTYFCSLPAIKKLIFHQWEKNNDLFGNSSATASQITDQLPKAPIDDIIKTIISPQSQLITAHPDDSNYLLWKYHVEIAIRGYGLEEYILGTVTIPPKFIADSQGKLISNKEYTMQQRQDYLLSSWLLSSISTNLLPQIIGCKTSKTDFNSQSAAKIMHYKRQMQNL